MKEVLKEYLVKKKFELFLGLVALIVTDLMVVFEPKLVGRVVDSVRSGDQRAAFFWCWGMLVVGGVMFVFRILWRLGFILPAWKFGLEYMERIFERAVGLPVHLVGGRYAVGDLLARITNDVRVLVMSLSFGLLSFTDVAVSTVLTISFMLGVSPKLTGISLLPLSLSAFLSASWFRRIFSLGKRVQDVFSEVAEKARNSFKGVRLIKSFVLEGKVAKDFGEIAEEYLNAKLNFVKYAFAVHPFLNTLFGISASLVMFFGARMVLSGELTLGQLVEFVMYVLMLTWVAVGLGYGFSMMQEGAAAYRRMREVMSEDAEEVGEPGVLRGDVRFDGVWFRYPGASRWALKNVNLVFKENRKTGIVGLTGSGKTTVVRLLLALYRPTKGEIYFGDRPYSSLSLAEIRNSISVSFQKDRLFSMTIEENLKLAEPEAPNERVWEALTFGGIDGEVRRFSDKERTMLGERGVGVSGGQRQRLSVSRAYLKRAVFYVFDDPVSSVDAHKEREMVERINSISGAGVVLVSQRVSAVMECDYVYVLKEGKVVEEGEPKELLKKGGIFSELHALQSGKTR